MNIEIKIREIIQDVQTYLRDRAGNRDASQRFETQIRFLMKVAALYTDRDVTPKMVQAIVEAQNEIVRLFQLYEEEMKE